MPDLDFHITGVRAASSGMTPLMIFDLEIGNELADEHIQSILLQTQIRIESTRRRYDDRERRRLVDLFGAPRDWGRTLGDLLWTNVSTTVTAFTGTTTTELTVPCTYDTNIAAAKYFYGIEDGEIPLIFLFTGTVFYMDGGMVQIQRISWESECRYRLPIERWRMMMNDHYPNSAWMYLDRDLFDRLYAFKQRNGFTSWNAVVSKLLAAVDEPEVAA